MDTRMKNAIARKVLKKQNWTMSCCLVEICLVKSFTRQSLSSRTKDAITLSLLDHLINQYCLSNFQVLQTGAVQAVEECQHQFRHSRWNCSTVENSTDIFGGVLKFSKYYRYVKLYIDGKSNMIQKET